MIKDEPHDDSPSDTDTNDDQSSTRSLRTPTIPFANFYIEKTTPSTSSASHCNTSRECALQSPYRSIVTVCLVHQNDESIFEFDLIDVPAHEPRLERSQVYKNVRVSHVDEHLAFVCIMLNDDWLAATRMLNDTFQQTLLEKQPPVDIAT